MCNAIAQEVLKAYYYRMAAVSAVTMTKGEMEENMAFSAWKRLHKGGKL